MRATIGKCRFEPFATAMAAHENRLNVEIAPYHLLTGLIEGIA